MKQPPPPLPHIHTHSLVGPVILNAKTTVHCSPGSSMVASDLSGTVWLYFSPILWTVEVDLFIPSSDTTCHYACQCMEGGRTLSVYISLWSVSVYSCVYPYAQAQFIVLILYLNPMQLVLNKEILLMLCLLVLLDEQRRMVLRLCQWVGHSNGRHGAVCVAVHLPIVHLNQRHKMSHLTENRPITGFL